MFSGVAVLGALAHGAGCGHLACGIGHFAGDVGQSAGDCVQGRWAPFGSEDDDTRAVFDVWLT